jgi:hypothetical protein
VRGAVAGSVVTDWAVGLGVEALAPEYQQILPVLDSCDSADGMRVTQLAVRLGLETTPARIEGGALTSEAAGLAGRRPRCGRTCSPSRSCTLAAVNSTASTTFDQTRRLLRRTPLPTSDRAWPLQPVSSPL